MAGGGRSEAGGRNHESASEQRRWDCSGQTLSHLPEVLHSPNAHTPSPWKPVLLCQSGPPSVVYTPYSDPIIQLGHVPAPAAECGASPTGTTWGESGEGEVPPGRIRVLW